MRNQTCHSVNGVSRFFGGNEEMGTLEPEEFVRLKNDFDVIGINRKSVFTIEEARRLFPIVYRLTKSYSERVTVLIQKLEHHNSKSKSTAVPEDSEVIEAEVGKLIQEWQTKVQKLGGLPNGQWVVDFDSGDGYYCWKFPERSLEFWHHYRDGFSKRIKISALSSQQPASRLAPVESVIDL